MAKDYIGSERTIRLEYDMDVVSEDNFKNVKRYVEKLQVTDSTDQESFGIVSYEYDASYVTDDFEAIKEELEKKFDFVTVEVYTGDMDDIYDDFTYDYNTLDIVVN